MLLGNEGTWDLLGQALGDMTDIQTLGALATLGVKLAIWSSLGLLRVGPLLPVYLLLLYVLPLNESSSSLLDHA